MFIDLQTTFSGVTAGDGTKTGQAITATAISTNVVDLRNAATPALVDESLIGEDMYLVVSALTAAAGGDAAKTLTITLESDSTANLATAPTVLLATSAIAGAAITAGAILVRAKLPSGNYQRYLGMRYTVSAGFTAFQVLAYLTPNIDKSVVYPIGFVVA